MLIFWPENIVMISFFPIHRTRTTADKFREISTLGRT